MIQGLQVDVKSAELKTILVERQEYHEKKAAVLTQEAANLRKANINIEEDMHVGKTTSGDVASNLDGKAREHREKANYYKFMIEHVIQDDIYRLGQEDLARLGITTRFY